MERISGRTEAPNDDSIICASDGSYRAHCDAGAHAYVIEYTQDIQSISSALFVGTNQTSASMEVKGFLALMTSLQQLYNNNSTLTRDIVIYVDSDYILKAVTQWMHQWASNRWRKTSTKTSIKHLASWRNIYDIIQWFNIKGINIFIEHTHSHCRESHRLNKLVDKVCGSLTADAAEREE